MGGGVEQSNKSDHTLRDFVHIGSSPLSQLQRTAAEGSGSSCQLQHVVPTAAQHQERRWATVLAHCQHSPFVPLLSLCISYRQGDRGRVLNKFKC